MPFLRRSVAIERAAPASTESLGRGELDVARTWLPIDAKLHTTHGRIEKRSAQGSGIISGAAESHRAGWLPCKRPGGCRPRKLRPANVTVKWSFDAPTTSDVPAERVGRCDETRCIGSAA